MKKSMILSSQRNSLFAVIAAVVFIIAASSLALAQDDFKVGDKIEAVDGGTWYKAQIIDAKDGQFKIHYEQYSDSTFDVWKSPNSLRRIGAPDPATINKATKYKPGDRVECDKASIGFWEKGTVVPFLPSDTTKNLGNFYRVRLDSFEKGGLYKAGHECNTVNIRPINEAPIKASGKYKVGDQIEAQNANFTWLPGKIIAVEGAFYKVHFDNHDSRHDESVSDDRIRPLGTTEKEAEAKTKQGEPLTPKMAGAFPSLPGTAWKIDFGRGVTGTVFQFCKNRRWEIVPQRAGSIGAVGRSFAVAGSTLTTVNADDGKVEKWKMTWKGGVLELFDGKTTLKLHYNGQNNC
ncbi:hypothetical protein BH10ACI3_BH10ACI3_08570 [soil metagenome]